jgi:hypothetical protein
MNLFNPAIHVYIDKRVTENAASKCLIYGHWVYINLLYSKLQQF